MGYTRLPSFLGQDLEYTNGSLESQIVDLTQKLHASQESEARKEAAVIELKARWGRISQQWSTDHEELFGRLKESQKENADMKKEILEAKQVSTSSLFLLANSVFNISCTCSKSLSAKKNLEKR